MSVLIFLGLIALIVWLSNRGGKGSGESTFQTNQKWVDYIAAFHRDAKTKAEKTLLDKMLNDLRQQGMPPPTAGILLASADVIRAAELLDTEAREKNPRAQDSPQAAIADSVPSEYNAIAAWSDAPEGATHQSTSIDNTTLLLYFGAFLFLASAGLFVALAGAYGPLRVAVVLIVMSALYFGGLWLQSNKPKLRTAGYTFIGMGLMLAPLAGLALYSYVMRDRPELVWLLTSLLCLGLYGHALRKIHSTFMEFIFIGTCVSLFESAISVLQMPVYYYGWGLAAMGLLLEAWAIKHGKETYDNPISVSGGLLIPVSVFAALYMTPQHGILQMAVSLALAAVYYGLQAWKAPVDSVNRVGYAAASHSALLLSAASFTYGVNHSFPAVALVVLAFAVPSLFWVLMRGATALMTTVANTTVVSLLVAVPLAWSKPWWAVIALSFMVATSLVVWLHQKRPDMYTVSMGFALGLPFLVGLHAAGSRWHAWGILVGVLVVSAVQLVVFFTVRRSKYDTVDWRLNWRALQLISFSLAFATAIAAGSGTVFAVAVIVALACYSIARVDAVAQTWLVASSVYVSLPALFGLSRPGIWLASLVVGCAWNLTLIFVNRLEAARWLGSFIWLLIPIGIAQVVPSLQEAGWYAGSYIWSMVGLVVARAVAQKRIARLPVALSELERRLHTDSQAYVVAYGIAGAVAAVASFLTDWRFMPLAICGVLAIFLAFIARHVEHQPDIMLFAPLLVQAGFWGTYQSGENVVLYVALSSLLALGGYVYGGLVHEKNGDYENRLQVSSLIMLYVAPATMLYFDTNWAMPVGLFVASLVTLHYVWSRAQSSREWAGGAAVVSLTWLLAYNGVHNIQVYAHIFAVLFGLYAYWRCYRGERETGHQYIVAMLCTATIPLGLQVIAGNAGGLYGWWFLGEQIFIMLLGMNLRDRFVTRWGMYVAVGSVLYQLRSLAWLSLTLLAVFLIGLAVYQLQKNDERR